MRPNPFAPSQGLPPPEPPEVGLLRTYVESVRRTDWPPPPVETLGGGQEILDREPESRARIVVLVSRHLANEGLRFAEGHALKSLMVRLLRTPLPWKAEMLVELVEHLLTPRALEFEMPATQVLTLVESQAAMEGLTAPLEKVLRRFTETRLRRLKVPMALRRSLDQLLQAGGRVVAADPWGRQVETTLGTLDEEQRQGWLALLTHAAETSGKTRPTQGWQKKAVPRVEALGIEQASATLVAWCQDLVPGPVDEGEKPLGEVNTEILRGLLWALAPMADRRLAAQISRLVEVSFRKVPWHGPRSARLGNGGVVALGMVPGFDGIAELSWLQGKVQYATGRRMIEATLDRAATTAGLGRVDLEELSIPDYGLDSEGRRRIEIGEGEAVLSIVGDEVVVRWELAGRRTKTVPKTLRESEPGRVKEVRELRKQIQTTLSGQAQRIERHYLQDRDLDVATWRERYLDHPLVSTLTRRLAWELFSTEGERQGLLWRDGALRDLAGETFSPLAKDRRIRLWHPVRATLEEVRTFRGLVTDAHITQPFKQVHREIYPLTAAEQETGNYSNRFAAHLLRQHQFQALCQHRRWTYKLQGEFDSHNVPTRTLEAWDLTVEFLVEPVEEQTTDMGIYAMVSSDQVRFRRQGALLELTEVPELALSETFRDVDLFTSVSSVGNDPTWEDRGEHLEGWHHYWSDFAFGSLNATAKTRRGVLAD